MQIYDDPLVYDVLSTPGTAAECSVLQRIAKAFAPPRGAWLEPACGSGRYLRVLAGRGVRVTGFDRSPVMTAYARRRVPQARIFTADMTRFSAQLRGRRFVFAFNLFNSIRHLPSDAAVLQHLQEMARVLVPGGIYAVGLSFTNYGGEPPDEDLWEGRRGALHVRQLVQYLPPGTWEPAGMSGRRLERVISHLHVRRGNRDEHLDSTYGLRCYDAAQWRRLVARSAMRPVAALDMRGRRVEDRPVYAIELLTPVAKRAAR